MIKKLLFTAAAIAAFGGLSAAPYHVSIRNAANFGLEDNGIACDGKGGFSDDGVSINNIAYADGINTVDEVPFDLIDPAKNGGRAVLTFECKKSKTGLREVVFDMRGKKARGGALNLLHTSTKSPDLRYTKIGKIEITYADGKKQKFEINYAIDVMNAFHPKNRANAFVWSPTKGNVPAYYFSRFKIDEKREIASLKLSTMDIATWVVAGITITDEYPTWRADSKEWVETNINDIAIVEGSALDVSKDFDDAPAGTYGRVVVSKKGKFAFEKKPNAKLKFHGTVWYMGGEAVSDVNKSKENLRKLCKIAKRQGYNLLRFHTSDYLCSKDPAKLALGFDLYDFLISEAGKNGIYLNLLIGNNIFEDGAANWEDRFSMKFRMILGDPKTREQWREHAKKQLEHINPYTGLAWKDDPAFMGMEYWNEMCLFALWAKVNDNDKKLGDDEFSKYLREKYETVENLNSNGKLLRKNYADFGKIGFLGELQSSEWAQFLQMKSRQFRDYCENVVKNEIGYKGLIYQFNARRSMNLTYMASEICDYTALNIYHSHPSEFMDIGSSINPKSSLENCADTFRAGATRKIFDRPVCMTEYNHCHWNEFKHEGGIVFGAYAALQDFDGMVVHSDGVKTGEKPNKYLAPFGIYNSPVFRANEFITYCLFKRGDAKRSKNRVEFFVPTDFVKNSADMNNTVNNDQSKIALLSGFAMRFENAQTPKSLRRVRAKKPNMTMLPVGAALTDAAQNFASTGANVGKKFDIEAFVQEMRTKGILGEDNITSPTQGIFQSDTGEIVLDSKNLKVSVITPKTEAVAFKKGTEHLDALGDVESSVPCSVAVCSVDGAPIRESKRMVLVYATDNINDNMVLSKDRNSLLQNATSRSKILIKRGRMSARLAVAPDTAFRLYELKYNGERKAEIPVELKDGKLEIKIDNSKNPTTFFEIAAQ